jgi:CHASE3 domain sensor protein
VCIVSGIFVIPIGILSIIVGIKLWRNAKNLENYKNTEKEEDLKEALKNLSAYYTLIGWITAIGLATLALVLIAILVLGLWLGLEILSK